MSSGALRKDHVLVVDDDPLVQQMLDRFLKLNGFDVSLAANGTLMRDVMKSRQVDMVLLDLNLPGGQDGIDLAREIRSHSDVPIMMLTDRNDVVDRIVGIEVGADDYVSKPFHLREVLARLKSILRRRRPTSAAGDLGDAPLRFEGWTLDPSRRKLSDPEGREIELTTGEFEMLSALARHAGRVLSRDFLMDQTRARKLDSLDRTIDAQIARLRRKIERDGHHPVLIKSVRGVGYMFAAKLDG